MSESRMTRPRHHPCPWLEPCGLPVRFLFGNHGLFKPLACPLAGVVVNLGIFMIWFAS